MVESSSIPGKQSLTQESDGEARFTGAGVSDEDNIFFSFDEGQSRELLDLGFVYPGLFVKGEALKGPVPWDLGPLEPVEKALILTMGLFLHQETMNHF